MNNKSFVIGLGFGLASGVITTLGLLIGLFASTYSKGVMLAGILTIAIADAFSDAAGIHISEESKGEHSEKEIWASTLFTFIFKFIVAISFFFIVFLSPITLGVILSIIWGFLLVGAFSYFIAKKNKGRPIMAVLEHSLIMVFVVFITYFLGKWINILFDIT